MTEYSRLSLKEQPYKTVAKFTYRLGVLVIYMREKEVYVPIVQKTPT